MKWIVELTANDNSVFEEYNNEKVALEDYNSGRKRFEGLAAMSSNLTVSGNLSKVDNGVTTVVEQFSNVS